MSLYLHCLKCVKKRGHKRTLGVKAQKKPWTLKKVFEWSRFVWFLNGPNFEWLKKMAASLHHFVKQMFFFPSHLPCVSPSLHWNTSPKWLTLYFFELHSWRHPGRAKMLCMLTKLIHKYTSRISDPHCTENNLKPDVLAVQYTDGRKSCNKGSLKTINFGCRFDTITDISVRVFRLPFISWTIY